MKLKYKLYYTFLSAAVITIFILLYQVLEVKDIDAAQINTAIVNSTDVSVMQKDDGSNLRKVYGLNKRDFEQYIHYAPKSNMEANEILILKLKDEKSADSVKAVIEERIKKESDSFKNYNKEQYEILKNHTLESKDGYIILIVSKDSDKINNAIDEIL